MTSELDMGKLDVLGFGARRSNIAWITATPPSLEPPLLGSNTDVHLLLFVALTAILWYKLLLASRLQRYPGRGVKSPELILPVSILTGKVNSQVLD